LGIESSTHLRPLPAGKIFAGKGYRDATIADICAQARTNVAAVNYHFGDKENLYMAAWRYAFRESMKNHPPVGGVPDDASPEKRLHGPVAALLQRIADPNERELSIMQKEMTIAPNDPHQSRFRGGYFDRAGRCGKCPGGVCRHPGLCRCHLGPSPDGAGSVHAGHDGRGLIGRHHGQRFHSPGGQHRFRTDGLDGTGPGHRAPAVYDPRGPGPGVEVGGDDADT